MDKSERFAVTDDGVTTELDFDAIITKYADRGYGLGAALRSCALQETFTWYDVAFTRLQVATLHPTRVDTWKVNGTVLTLNGVAYDLGASAFAISFELNR